MPAHKTALAGSMAVAASTAKSMMKLPTLKFSAKPLLPPQCFGQDEICAMFSERSSVSEGYSARVAGYPAANSVRF
jgi:hypothetical protein